MTDKFYEIREIRHRSKTEQGLWHDHTTAAMLKQEVAIMERIREKIKFYEKHKFGFLFKRIVSLLKYIERGSC